MIYSEWRPDTGQYDYFEAPSERLGMADDLPVPILRGDSPIGVASTEVGRRPTTAVKFVGRGDSARGSILPLSRAGLGQAGGFSLSSWIWIGAAVAFGWWLGRRSR